MKIITKLAKKSKDNKLSDNQIKIKKKYKHSKKDSCSNDNPDDMCDKCTCWKATRANCS